MLFIGLGEEPGFRGFALPKLLESRSALVASLIVGVLHSIWHLPLLISGEMPFSTILIVIAGAFIFTWLFKNTNGSILIAILFHTAVDVWGSVFSSLFVGADTARYANWEVVAYVGVAVAVVLLTGPSLVRRSVQSKTEMKPVIGA
jgi:membrane protease YdiL (CAAX protease family)